MTGGEAVRAGGSMPRVEVGGQGQAGGGAVGGGELAEPNQVGALQGNKTGRVGL